MTTPYLADGSPAATCPHCLLPMNGAGCTVTTRVLDGKPVDRIPYTIVLDGMADHCNDCNTPVGGFHHHLCDQDACPICTAEPGCSWQASFCRHQDQGWPSRAAVT